MNIFELEIFDDEGSACTIYSVKWEGAEMNEAEKFFCRFEEKKNKFHEESNKLLWMVIEVIGNRYGAIDDFFDRTKNKAQALPPKPKKRIAEIKELGIDFPLRLYCYRISASIIVLFDGGYKDARSDQQSDDIRLKFYEAQSFADKLSEALISKEILISDNGRYLTNINGGDEIIL